MAHLHTQQALASIQSGCWLSNWFSQDLLLLAIPNNLRLSKVQIATNQRAYRLASCPRNIVSNLTRRDHNARRFFHGGRVAGAKTALQDDALKNHTRVPNTRLLPKTVQQSLQTANAQTPSAKSTTTQHQEHFTEELWTTYNSLRTLDPSLKLMKNQLTSDDLRELLSSLNTTSRPDPDKIRTVLNDMVKIKITPTSQQWIYLIDAMRPAISLNWSREFLKKVHKSLDASTSSVVVDSELYKSLVRALATRDIVGSITLINEIAQEYSVVVSDSETLLHLMQRFEIVLNYMDLISRPELGEGSMSTGSGTVLANHEPNESSERLFKERVKAWQRDLEHKSREKIHGENGKLLAGLLLPKDTNMSKTAPLGPHKTAIIHAAKTFVDSMIPAIMKPSRYLANLLVLAHIRTGELDVAVEVVKKYSSLITIPALTRLVYRLSYLKPYNPDLTITAISHLTPEELLQPEYTRLAVLIAKHHVWMGAPEEALRLLTSLDKTQLTQFNFESIMHAIANSKHPKSVEHVESVYRYLFECSLEPTIGMYNGLLLTYNLSHHHQMCLALFNKLFALGDINNMSVSIVFDSCGYANNPMAAREIFKRLKENGWKFSENNLNSYIECLARTFNLAEAKEVLWTEFNLYPDKPSTILPSTPQNDSDKPLPTLKSFMTLLGFFKKYRLAKDVDWLLGIVRHWHPEYTAALEDAVYYSSFRSGAGRYYAYNRVKCK